MCLCLRVLKTFCLVFCRFPDCITEQRYLPVNWPAKRVLRPGQSLQPGPGQQTRSPHILREAGSVFSSDFYCSATALSASFSGDFALIRSDAAMEVNRLITLNHLAEIIIVILFPSKVMVVFGSADSPAGQIQGKWRYHFHLLLTLLLLFLI